MVRKFIIVMLNSENGVFIHNNCDAMSPYVPSATQQFKKLEMNDMLQTQLCNLILHEFKIMLYCADFSFGH
jgi:hypothetical protein